MTPEQTQRLEQIRARAAARTPGKWKNDDEEWSVTTNDRADDMLPNGYTVVDDIPNRPDREFIANAPTDIDTLLALVEAYAGAWVELNVWAKAHNGLPPFLAVISEAHGLDKLP